MLGLWRGVPRKNASNLMVPGVWILSVRRKLNANTCLMPREFGMTMRIEALLSTNPDKPPLAQ